MLTNGPVQIDFHKPEFALRRAGLQTATTAEPGTFADYLASVLNPSTQDPYGVPDRRSDDATRAAYGERQRVDEPGSRTERSPESKRADADHAASDTRPPAAESAGPSAEQSGAAASESPDDARADGKTAGGKPDDEAGDAGLDDKRGDVTPSDGKPADGVTGRGQTGAVDGRDGRAAGRRDGDESSAGARNLRGVKDGEGGDPVDVRFDEHGRPFVELDVEMDSGGRTGADGSNDGARVSLRANAARTAVTGADVVSAEAGGTGSRARLRAGEGDARENEDTRDGRGARRIEIRDLRGRAAARPDSGDASGQGRDGSSDTTGAFDRSALKPQGAAADASSVHGSGETDSNADSSGHTAATPTSVRGSDAPSQSPAQSPAQASASAHLRQALHEHLNGDIVRAARLIIRNRDSGEIRLHLKPESLGSVRISLQMQDGHIAGRIIVDNQTVREAFEQNLASLQRAFQESGLEASGVEVSVADSGGQQDGGGETGGQTASRTIADHFGQVVPDFEWFEEQHELVDMVV